MIRTITQEVLFHRNIHQTVEGQLDKGIVIANMTRSVEGSMGWLRLVGFLKSHVSFAKEPCKRDDILQKRLVFLRSLLIVATP